MRTRMALALAASLLVGAAGTAQATDGKGQSRGFPTGWTTVTARECVLNYNNGLLIVPVGRPGAYLYTLNPAWIAPIAAICRAGKTFDVHVERNKWDFVRLIQDKE